MYIPVVVALYERSGEHTYAPMSLLSLNLLIVILLIPVFYKLLAPRTTGGNTLYKASLYPTATTGQHDQERGLFVTYTSH